jgi:hypothetical protein
MYGISRMRRNRKVSFQNFRKRVKSNWPVAPKESQSEVTPTKRTPNIPNTSPLRQLQG